MRRQCLTDVRQLLIKSEHLLQGVPLIVPEISSMPSNIIIPCLLFALAHVCSFRKKHLSSAKSNFASYCSPAMTGAVVGKTCAGFLKAGCRWNLEHVWEGTGHANFKSCFACRRGQHRKPTHQQGGEKRTMAGKRLHTYLGDLSLYLLHSTPPSPN